MQPGKKSLSRPKTKQLVLKTILTAVLWAGGILCILPFLWMISTSFKGMNDVYNFPIEWIPKNPTVKAYEMLFSSNFSFFTFYRNSLLWRPCPL